METEAKRKVIKRTVGIMALFLWVMLSVILYMAFPEVEPAARVAIAACLPAGFFQASYLLGRVSGKE